MSNKTDKAPVDKTGGGILVDGGILTMFCGIISNNSTWKGGGVYIKANGRFTMHGGTFSGNKTGGYSQTYGVGSGGGVHIENGGYFAKTPLATGEPRGIIYGKDVGQEFTNTS
jgi:hypothetical protein